MPVRATVTARRVGLLRMTRLWRWTPAIVFAVLTFAHAAVLPTFEGMDEPAHLSSILQFADGHGRPVPGVARLHRSVERAVALAPGPYHQWEPGRRLGGLTYVEWRQLSQAEQQRRARELATLPADTWEDGDAENWQAQHPPFYYAVVGAVLRVSGVTSFESAHRLARFVSAAMFATTGVMLTAFLTGPWGASPWSALFVVLLPMWYVIGARISNDALAMPALGLALLIVIDELRRPAETWRWSAWAIAGVAATIGLAAKAYGLAFFGVAAIVAAVALSKVVRAHAPARIVGFPLIAVGLMLAGDGWWLWDNVARGAGLTGMNEVPMLAVRAGVVTLGDRLPYLYTLVFDQPRQLGSVVLRGVAQALYASNWTIGAAPWWFYAAEISVIAIVLLPLLRRPWSRWPAALQSAAVVAAITLAILVAGIAKSVLDYFILFGETRLAQGFYVWSVGSAFTATLALALDLAPPRRQRLVVAVQAVCLATTLATDVMFWSGRYDRDPVWRTPVRVHASLDEGHSTR